VPVVFLHGLTFDRRTWRPIVHRLGGSVRSIAIDLPAHGESAGPPAALDVVAGRVHELLDALDVDAPIVVGHSMAGAVAYLFAATYATRGVVDVDNGPDVRPFARLVRHLAPVLQGPDFADAWEVFETGLGLERIPEPVRSLVNASHTVDRDVVVGYWDMVLRTEPEELQAWIDATTAKISVPVLGVFGRPVTNDERERLDRLPDVQLEVCAGDGHFVHLVDPDRFTARLRRFVDHCMRTTTASA
jgi:pimeloyl-ACP methyl ester carboxylesterase